MISPRRTRKILCGSFEPKEGVVQGRENSIMFKRGVVTLSRWSFLCSSGLLTASFYGELSEALLPRYIVTKLRVEMYGTGAKRLP